MALMIGQTGPICPGCGDITVITKGHDTEFGAMCIGHTPESGQIWAINADGDYISEDGSVVLKGSIPPTCAKCEQVLRPKYKDGKFNSAYEALDGWECGTETCPDYAPGARWTWASLGQIAKPVVLDREAIRKEAESISKEEAEKILRDAEVIIKPPARPCHICGSTPDHETETRKICSAIHPWETKA